MPNINFGPNADQSVVSDFTKEVLNSILEEAGLSSCKITSTSRTPADQARVMYNNIIATSVNKQKALYAAAGDKVIDVYVARKAAGDDPDDIKTAMEEKIIDLGPSKVSRHCADPSILNVIDIAPSSITDKVAFEEAVNNSGDVSRFILPPLDPAYHLEIPQT